jgi:hypothetical protein
MSAKERPILFSGPMVCAILDGSKTQTRRVANHPLAQSAVRINSYMGQGEFDCIFSDDTGGIICCPHGTPGDRLWVRETWAVQHEYDAAAPSEIGASARWHYAATEDLGGLRKRPSIFLPRRGSRILLEVTDVRVQRLQDISEDDARAEGAAFHDGRPIGHHGWRHDINHGVVHSTARDSFMWIWERINGAGSWNANPWVWALTFRRLQP